jgi:hypothetical protein
MVRLALLPLLVLALASCAEAPPAMKPVEFLTRSGCVQTEIMRVRLDAAIEGLTKPIAYTVVDLDTLPAGDVRKAYPTPTVLAGSVDIFGMTEPKPPYPEPT